MQNVESFGFNVSLLFVEFSLEKSLVTRLFRELMISGSYLESSYEHNSIMRSPKHLSTLFDILALLDQFTFDFGLLSQSEIIVSQTNNNNNGNSSPVQTAAAIADSMFLAQHPVDQLRAAIKAIVQHFSAGTTCKEDLERLGDDSRNQAIGMLVRGKLCQSLLLILNNGLGVTSSSRSRFFGIFGSSNKSSSSGGRHIWNLLEEMAKSKKVSAGDLGGVQLPAAITTVNEMINRRKEMRDACDVKFRSLVCYALNYSMLHLFVQSVVSDKAVDKYYDERAMIRDSQVQQKVLVLLEKLSKLPFSLALDAEVY